MSIEISLHNVTAVELEKHVFDGFFNSDLVITTADGQSIKLVMYSRVGEIAVMEHLAVEDHRKGAA